jgi:hypothetical protein
MVANAGEITLFDNGSVSGEQVLRNNMEVFTIYDDFILTKRSIIDEIDWYQTEQRPDLYLSTTLTIFGGIPSDATLLDSLVVTAERTLSPPDPVYGALLPDGSFSVSAVADHLNIHLDAGTYWLGIHNDYSGNGASQWSQTIGTSQTFPGRYQGETNGCGVGLIGPDGGCLKYFAAENSAFQVIGKAVPVPEPNSLYLFSYGLLVVLVLALRNRPSTTVTTEQ